MAKVTYLEPRNFARTVPMTDAPASKGSTTLSGANRPVHGGYPADTPVGRFQLEVGARLYAALDVPLTEALQALARANNPTDPYNRVGKHFTTPSIRRAR